MRALVWHVAGGQELIRSLVLWGCHAISKYREEERDFVKPCRKYVIFAGKMLSLVSFLLAKYWHLNLQFHAKPKMALNLQ